MITTFDEEIQRKHPNGRMYRTGLRSITPEAPLIDSTDPRWEKAEYEDIRYLIDGDGTFAIPSTWTQVSGPTAPETTYKGKITWINK